ncbi:Transposable element tcb1 transposase [Caligus rogercresseyi]|uniref:Transposable element tcb1 transposase n=1 Tax=Caligus rogercresseyi TaxID=217165 RepID=A0A7T8K7X1_CALRO|nr:Transposable element tcb1 transposase [Caligus rogercresseyi]
MVLGVISSEGDVMPPHFFEKGLKVNTAIYIDVMKNVVKPWMDLVANGRPYVFQQDSAPAHKSKPPLQLEPGLNKTHNHVHNTLDSIKAAIVEEFGNMKKDVVAKACGRFRHRLEMVVAADGGYIEK